MHDKTKQYSEKERAYWLDKERNVNIVIASLGLLCATLLIFDFFYHKHAHFEFEHWFGFFGWFGFLVCIGLVLVAKAIRCFLKRDERYYDS